MGLNNDDIRQLIAILQKGLCDTDSDNLTEKQQKIQYEETDQENEEESIVNTKSVRKTKKGSSKNKFLSMGVKDLHKEDTAIDQLLNSNPPTARTRKFSSVNVTCRSCGKKESISPLLLHDSVDRYKCNKCSTNPG